MQCLVIPSTRLTAFGDEVFARREGLAWGFWSRYLRVFDHVTVMARVDTRPTRLPDSYRVNRHGVSVLRLPSHPALAAMMAPLKLRQWVRQTRGAVFLRSPSLHGDIAILTQVPRLTVAVEVVGNPFAVADAFRDSSWTRFAALRGAASISRVAVRSASSVSYVSQSSLASVLPPSNSALIAEFSSIALDEDWFAKEIRTIRSDPPFRIVSVGNFAAPHKGFDDLLQALAAAKVSGLTFTADVLGQQSASSARQVKMIQQMGLDRVVNLHGEVPHDHVRQFLDRADLFILPSRTEGMPRVLIEAMAIGLPAIATDVGGVRDLVTAPQLVKPHQPLVMGKRIQQIMSNAELRRTLSEENIKVARRFRTDVLQPKRDEFYRHHAQVTRNRNRIVR